MPSSPRARRSRSRPGSTACLDASAAATRSWPRSAWPTRATAYARTLSGGMRRRLLVAKALVHQPPVVVLDEPTAGVDVELRRSLWSYMRELNRQGVTVVLTTHYLEEAEAMCDRIAIIDRGEVVACDDKAALIGRLDEKQLTVVVAEPLGALPGDSPGSAPGSTASIGWCSTTGRAGPGSASCLTRSAAPASRSPILRPPRPISRSSSCA